MGQYTTMKAGTGQWERLVQPILAGRLMLCVCSHHQAQQLHSDDGGGMEPECAAGVMGGLGEDMHGEVTAPKCIHLVTS